MTEFALAHPWLTSLLVTECVFMATMSVRALARALQAWGTRHCGTCACHTESQDDGSAP